MSYPALRRRKCSAFSFGYDANSPEASLTVDCKLRFAILSLSEALSTKLRSESPLDRRRSKLFALRGQTAETCDVGKLE